VTEFRTIRSSVTNDLIQIGLPTATWQMAKAVKFCLTFGRWIVQISEMIPAIPGVHKFSKYLGTTSRFCVPERWQDSSSILRTRNSGVTCETVIRRLLLGACELIHIFLCKEKNCRYYAEIFRSHSTKFSRPGDLAPGICAPLRYLDRVRVVFLHSYMQIQKYYLKLDH
jgi:hypothetical protein